MRAGPRAGKPGHTDAWTTCALDGAREPAQRVTRLRGGRAVSVGGSQHVAQRLASGALPRRGRPAFRRIARRWPRLLPGGHLQVGHHHVGGLPGEVVQSCHPAACLADPMTVSHRDLPNRTPHPRVIVPSRAHAPPRQPPSTPSCIGRVRSSSTRKRRSPTGSAITTSSPSRAPSRPRPMGEASET